MVSVYFNRFTCPACGLWAGADGNALNIPTSFVNPHSQKKTLLAQCECGACGINFTLATIEADDDEEIEKALRTHFNRSHAR